MDLFVIILIFLTLVPVRENGKFQLGENLEIYFQVFFDNLQKKRNFFNFLVDNKIQIDSGTVN